MPLRSGLGAGEGEERGWRRGPASWAPTSAPGSRCVPTGAGGNGPSLRGAPLRARGKQLAPFRPRPGHRATALAAALNGAGGGPRPTPPPAPTARVERRRWQRGAAHGPPPPTGDSPTSPPKIPQSGREACWPGCPGGAHAWGRRNSSASRSRRPRIGDRDPGRGHAEAPGGKLQPVGQRAQLPSGSRGGAPLHARPSQAPSPPGGKRLPQGNHPKCPGAGLARPDGPIASPARPQGRDPGRGREPGAAASGPIHGKFPSVLEDDGQSWGCGWQPAQPPSCGGDGGTPLYLQPRFSTAETEGGRGGEPSAARSPAASSFTLKNKTNPNLDPQHPGPCLHPPRCSPRECCFSNCPD